MPKISTLVDNPELKTLLARAVEAAKLMSPTEREAMFQAQSRSWLMGEIGMGDDADEAAYANAVNDGDEAEIARLNAESAARVADAKARLDQEAL